MKRYREALATRGEDNLPPGIKLIKETIEPLAAAIQKAVDEGLEGKASRSVSVIQYLSQFEPDAVAFMTAKVCIWASSRNLTVQAVAVEISSRLEGMLNFDKLKEENPRAHVRLMKVLKAHPGLSSPHRHVVIRKQQAYAGVVRIKWGVGEKLRIGTLLAHMMCEVTGLVKQDTQVVGHNKTLNLLVPTPATVEWLKQSHARCELLSPFYMPMLTRPLPWSGPYGGGYLTKELRYPLIKTANKLYLEELSYTDMPIIYGAINALQDTAWAINQGVYRVLAEIWDGGGRIGKLPTVADEELPAKTHDLENPDPAELKAWKRKAAKVHEGNHRNRSKRVQLSAKLWVAEKFSQAEAFYFPHALDWRGRAYPVSSGLNPQGDDVSKALLKFAEGKKLGENGAYWLAVHGANCFGVDKVSFEERVQWVGDHYDQILESALNPVNGSRFWADADSPYQFLAFCLEWLGYSMAGDEHVSHLSVSFDGTCNGLQNFSAMLRDEIGGAAVGLVPSEKPSDIYTVVRDKANERIAQDAATGSTIASRWVGKVTRQLTKQNTMTVPYGVSKFGMKDQLLSQFQKLREDGVDFGFDTTLEDAQYLSEVNWDAIGQTVVAARLAMDWLQKAAQVVAANDLPISWVTPSGLPVLQSYRKVFGKEYDFDVEGKRYRMTLKVEGDKLDRRKQSSGISPNFVHSLDAAHLMRTITYCTEAGITSFAMIHDSYGSHAADADILLGQLRRAFVDQYSLDILNDFRDQMIAGLPVELANKIPAIPPMGTLDLSGVLDSEYFFS
jgi:DNA-directed RNA polymerase